MPNPSDADILISPSIIAADLSTLGETVRAFDPAMVDLLHIDVMDGHFVPNLTIGPGYIQSLMKHTSIPFDVHLMIDNPDTALERYIGLAPWVITIHHESTRFPLRLLSVIKSAAIRRGLSINPATPVESIYDMLPDLDMVLVMSVDPGFYGQAFMPAALRRIRKLSDFLRREGLDRQVRIQVDGGITRDNAADVAASGATVLVTGKTAFEGGDVNKNVSLLKSAARQGLKPAPGK
jgi:ribulose-phosphate 3-epimerase